MSQNFEITALCFRLNRKCEIGIFSKMSTSIISDRIFGDCPVSFLIYVYIWGLVEQSQLDHKDLQ